MTLVRRPLLARLAEFLSCLAIATLLIGWTLWSSYTIGNDYIVWPIYPNLVHYFYTHQGAAATWYPHYSGGLPFSGLAGLQIFNLPSWLISLFPGYAEGGAVVLNSAKHLLLFALSHWLAARFITVFLRLRFPVAFLISAALLYNLRTLDALRYGMYIEATLYFQAALLIAYWFLQKQTFLRALAFGLFVHCALTAGYPGVLFFGAAAVALLTLLGFAHLPGTFTEKVRQFGVPALLLGLVSFVSLLLASPNWWPAGEMIEVNSVRIINSTLEWATQHSMTWGSIVTNLFYPWESEVHSGFGGSSLWSILLLSLALFCLIDLRRSWWALLLLLFPFVYALGGELFKFFFYYVPGFSWIRIPGRVFVILPALLLVGGAIKAAQLSNTQSSESRNRRLIRCLNIGNTINLVALLLTSTFLWLQPDWLLQLRQIGYAPVNITGWDLSLRYLWLGAGILGSAFLGLILKGQNLRFQPWLYASLLTVFLVQAFLTNRFGTWVTLRYETPTTADFLKADHLPYYYSAPLIGHLGLDELAGGMATTDYTSFMKSAGENAGCILPVDRGAGSNSVLLPFYLTTNLSCTSSEEAQREELSHFSCNRKTVGTAFAVQSVCASIESAYQEPLTEPEPATPICGAYRKNPTQRELALLNQSNRLRFLGASSAIIEVDTPKAALLVTPYPWSNGYWTATVDGIEVQIEKINAGIVGVVVPAGNHTVRIQYVSERAVKSRWLVFFTLLFVCLGILIVMWRKAQRPPLQLVILINLGLAALLICSFTWARGYNSSDKTALSLNNSYTELLTRQLVKWRCRLPLLLLSAPNDNVPSQPVK